MVGANDASARLDLNVYRERIAEVMDIVKAPGRRFVWVGQPNMGPQRPDLQAMLPRMNAIAREEAARRPWVLYIDAWALTSDAAGAYAQFLPDSEGVEQRIREGDGVHLTAKGGERIADAVMAALFP
jgi:hypothetical protein